MPRFPNPSWDAVQAIQHNGRATLERMPDGPAKIKLAKSLAAQLEAGIAQDEAFQAWLMSLPAQGRSDRLARDRAAPSGADELKSYMGG